ncbi:MAG: sigma-70 family RNA polymerase sigma factor [Candidatus Firestonebacteria bacterium]|nr:sigma-70 family RNA polymerase sigma factor [Candidatus Firestonebacteria bacterium]
MTRELADTGTGPTQVKIADGELIARTLAGETRAFDELMLRYRDRVYRLAYHMLWNEQEADDAAQEVFVRAYCHLKKFRGDSGFFTWLYRIAKNVVYTQAKKSGRRREIARLAHRRFLLQGRPAPTPEAYAERGELRELIRDGLRSLEPKQQEVLVLRGIEGLDNDEVARVLNVPVGTVKSRFFRAQENLRQWFEAHEPSRQEGQA